MLDGYRTALVVPFVAVLLATAVLAIGLRRRPVVSQVSRRLSTRADVAGPWVGPTGPPEKVGPDR